MQNTSYFKRKKIKKIDRNRIDEKTIEVLYDQIKLIWSEESILKRNLLLFRLLFESGFRVGELLHLRCDDFDYPDPFEKVGNIYLIERGEEDNESRQLKTGERVVTVSSDLLKEMDEYLLYYRPQLEQVDYLFVSHSTSNKGSHLSYSAVQRIFKKIANDISVERFNITPHALRHTHASNLSDTGVDVNVIKARLGHMSIETTSQYITPSIETMKKSYESYLKAKENTID